MNRIILYLAAGAAALTLAACNHAPPAGVAAEVNGHAITTSELDKAYQSNYAQQSEGASEDQVMAQKIDLLGSLINNEIMLQRAEKLGLNATDADVDAEIAKMRSPYTKEEFDKQLSDRHMTMDDLHAQKRRQLTIDKLINKEITSKIVITDGDVKAFYEANKASFNLAEPAVHMAQIFVSPYPDSNIRNLKNSKAQNDKEAKLKIEDLMARLRRNEDFAMLAQNYSEDPNTSPNGGDMGFVRESDLEKANTDLRKMVASLPPERNLPHHPHAGRLPHPQGDHQGTGRAARTQRSARAAEHPGDADQQQEQPAAGCLLRSGAQRRQDLQLPGAKRGGRRRQEQVAGHFRINTAIRASVIRLSPVAFCPALGTAGRSTSATEATRPVKSRSLTTLARSRSMLESIL